jgi:hypothetical protein
MLQLTLHSLGIGATVSPETFSNVRAMLPLRVTPTKLITTRGPTVHSYYATKPNGAKPSTAGTRHRFDRLQTVMADANFDRAGTPQPAIGPNGTVPPRKCPHFFWSARCSEQLASSQQTRCWRERDSNRRSPRKDNDVILTISLDGVRR